MKTETICSPNQSDNIAISIVTRRDKQEIPDISIVIPTYNRVKVLLEVLNAIRMQTLTNYELIVVDNGPSTDQTRQELLALMEDDGRIVYISTAEKGAFIARNIGCHCTRSDLILTTDDDWEMTDPSTLQYIVHAFDEEPRLGVLGIGHDYSDRWSSLSFAQQQMNKLEAKFNRPGTISQFGRVTAKYYTFPTGAVYQVGHVRSCCMAFRSDIAEPLGFFPTVYVTKNSGIGYRSETELCHKIASAGFDIIYSTEILGNHKGTERPSGVFSRKHTESKLRYQARNHMLFMLRNYWPGRYGSLFLALDLLIGNRSQPGLIGVFLSRRFFGRWRSVQGSVKGKWEGFCEYHSLKEVAKE